MDQRSITTLLLTFVREEHESHRAHGTILGHGRTAETGPSRLNIRLFLGLWFRQAFAGSPETSSIADAAYAIDAGMLSSTSVPESSSLQTVSLAPTRLARSFQSSTVGVLTSGFPL